MLQPNLHLRPLHILVACLAFAACDDDGTVLETESTADDEDGTDEESSTDSSSTGDDGSGDTMVPSGSCIDVTSEECDANEGCVAVWGAPYSLDFGDEWCIHGNGVEYLGCAEISTCTDFPGTMCRPLDDTIFDVNVMCDLRSYVVECEPPVEDAPPC